MLDAPELTGDISCPHTSGHVPHQSLLTWTGESVEKQF